MDDRIGMKILMCSWSVGHETALEMGVAVPAMGHRYMLSGRHRGVPRVQSKWELPPLDYSPAEASEAEYVGRHEPRARQAMHLRQSAGACSWLGRPMLEPQVSQWDYVS